MSELKNCKRCGSVFPSNAFSNLCYICAKKDDEDFSKIRDYLYDNPFSKIYDVAAALDISINKIIRFLREGRLEIVEESNVFLHCEMCGQSIRSGKYCDACISKTTHDFKVVFSSKPPKNPDVKFKYLTHSK